MLLAAQVAVAATPQAGWAVRRVGNMPDGAPAFEVLSPKGRVAARIECLQNGWVDPDDLAVRLMRATAVMAAIQAKGGRLDVEDLGPAKFDCVPVFRSPDTERRAKP
jgi:hypothetical protein